MIIGINEKDYYIDKVGNVSYLIHKSCDIKNPFSGYCGSVDFLASYKDRGHCSTCGEQVPVSVVNKIKFIYSEDQSF